MSPEEAAELQRKYRQKRRRWAWRINRPYSHDVGKPEPGELDAGDSEEGW